MDLVDAILLGVLEGLTEFLPVSSTGHLILLSELLKHQGEAAKSFDIIIQLGAIVAVGVYFRDKIREMLRDLIAREGGGLTLLLALMAAFVPTAFAGLMLHRVVKAKLFGPGPVAAALIVGGVVMMVVERWHRGRAPQSDGLKDVTISKGFIIGLCQCVALWPGSSRSMTTIVGGQLCGLSTKTAAEFSFLLALPTLGAATVYDFYKNGDAVLAMPSGGITLVVGLLVSFLVAWAVVAVFLKYVTRVGMTPFGIYRIVLGAAVLMWA